MRDKSPPISVITATLNCATMLPKLINSLREQTYKNFEWVVADGGSTDSTLRLLKAVRDLKVTISSQKDFGIYDALNRGIQNASGQYYVVLGADDWFYPDAIQTYWNAIEQHRTDFVAMSLKVDGKTIRPRRRTGWLYGMAGVASSHSVGLAIRKELHSNYGYYSTRLRITADQLFVKTAIRAGASVHRSTVLVGEMSGSGYSAQNALYFLSEFFISQIATERYVLPQIFLLLLRLLKNFRRLK